METLIGKLMDSAATIVAAGIVGAVWINLRWIVSSRRSMERILSEIVFMRGNVTVLFRLQGPQIMSLKATLEAQRDGECNGNVDKALEMIEEARKEYDEHLLSTFAGLREGTAGRDAARSAAKGGRP